MSSRVKSSRKNPHKTHKTHITLILLEAGWRHIESQKGGPNWPNIAFKHSNVFFFRCFPDWSDSKSLPWLPGYHSISNLCEPVWVFCHSESNGLIRNLVSSYIACKQWATAKGTPAKSLLAQVASLISSLNFQYSAMMTSNKYFVCSAPRFKLQLYCVMLLFAISIPGPGWWTPRRRSRRSQLLKKCLLSWKNQLQHSQPLHDDQLLLILHDQLLLLILSQSPLVDGRILSQSCFYPNENSSQPRLKTHSIFTVVQHASWSFEDWTHTLADASNTRGDDNALMHYSLLPTRFSIQQYLKPLKFLSQKTLRKWSDFVLLRMADLMGKDQVQKKLKTLRTVYSFFAGIDCQRFAWKMITGSCERLWGFRPMILFDSAVNDSVMSIFSKQWCQNNLLDSTLRLYQTIDLTYFFTSLGLNIIEGWEEEEQAGHDDRLAPTEQFLCVRRHLGHDFQQSVRKWFVGSQKNHLEENSLVRQTSERMLGLASRAKSVWAWRLGQVRTFQYEPRLKDSI